MGNKPSQQINPNDYQGKTQQNPQHSREQLHRELVAKCQAEAIEGWLTYDRFNNVLNVLEVYNVILLRKTPLAKRMFNGLDTNRTGKVGSTQIISMLNNLVTGSDDWCVRYSFSLYDERKINRIDKAQFLKVMEESFIVLYRLLFDHMVRHNIDKEKNIDSNAIEELRKGNMGTFIHKMEAEFAKYDYERKGYWDYQQFKQWCMESAVNGVVAAYENIVITIPFHLIYRNMNQVGSNV